MRKRSLVLFLTLNCSHTIVEIGISNRKPLLKEVALGTSVVAHGIQLEN